MKLLGKIKREFIFLKVKRKNCFKKRLSIIGPQFFKFGKNIHIGKYYKLQCHDSYYMNKFKYCPSILIEDNVYIGDFFTIITASNVTIKKNTLIASYVTICSLNHGVNLKNGVPYINQELTVDDIIIGENCWIGEKAIILPGVKIGNNCIIGAGSIVTRNIDDNSIVVGNPAKVIKKWDFENDCWRNV